MANEDTLIQEGSETPRGNEQLTPADAFASAFPEAKDNQPQVAPHPAQNQGLVEEATEIPDIQQQEVPVQQVNEVADNEERRYQYWQSQAAKQKNENARLTKQMQAMQSNFQPQQPQVQPEAPKGPEFPPAPEKPSRPRNFNRSDALEDPNSESARYLDSMDGWQEDMDNYNQLKVEYNNARFSEEADKMKKQQQSFFRQQKRFAQQEAQAQQAAEYVAANYGASDEQAVDFVQKMSDDKSITLDNLWKLYLLNSGQQVAPSANPENLPNKPSPAFQQTQRAQQVPSPMGVVPSANTSVDGRTQEDAIMDDLINAHKSKNPW